MLWPESAGLCPPSVWEGLSTRKSEVLSWRNCVEAVHGTTASVIQVSRVLHSFVHACIWIGSALMEFGVRVYMVCRIRFRFEHWVALDYR